jgi:hypothetical protein
LLGLPRHTPAQCSSADTDLLITRTTMPLRVPAAALLRLVQGRPPGTDSQLNIR